MLSGFLVSLAPSPSSYSPCRLFANRSIVVDRAPISAFVPAIPSSPKAISMAFNTKLDSSFSLVDTLRAMPMLGPMLPKGGRGPATLAPALPRIHYDPPRRSS